MLDKTPNLWYNNWVGLARVGPQKVTFAEVEALLMMRYPDDTRAQIHKTVGLMIASGEIKL